MGWEERHLFAFEIGERTFMLPDPEISRSKKVYDPRRYTLERVFPALPGHGMYAYDFGDRWEHDFEITGAEDAVYRKQYPICVDGAGECPPEDCGGPPGYEYLQKNGGLERYGRRTSFGQRARRGICEMCAEACGKAAGRLAEEKRLASVFVERQ